MSRLIYYAKKILKILIVITTLTTISQFLYLNNSSTPFEPKFLVGNGGEKPQYNLVRNLNEIDLSLTTTDIVKGIEKVGKGTVNTTLVKPTVKNNSDENVVFYKPAVLEGSIQLMDKDSDLYQFLKEQKNRTKVVYDVCNTSDKKIKLQLKMRHKLKHIIIDRKTHLTFCPVYKAASTTWSTYLLKLGGFWEKAQEKYPDHFQNKLIMVYNKTISTLVPKLSQGTTKFMVVRHPIDRLVSCYRDKFEGANKDYYYMRYGESMIRDVRKPLPSSRTEKNLLLKDVRDYLYGNMSISSLNGNPYINPIGPTFREFLEFVFKHRHTDEHWRPYYNHCFVCGINYDFYLKFEDLDRESQLFVKYLKQESRLQIEHDNMTKGGSTVSQVVCTYLSTISKYTFDKIVEKYEIDYMLFGYDTNKYSNCTMKGDKIG